MTRHVVRHLTEILVALFPTIKALESAWLSIDTGWAVGSSPEPCQSH